MSNPSNKIQVIPKIPTWRPKLIIGITAFMTLCAILYAFFIAKPVYEARALIQVGKINGNHVERIKSTREKIAFTHLLDARGVDKKLPVVSSADVLAGQTDLLLIKTIGYNNEDAVKLLQAEINTLIERQTEDVEKGRKVYETTIKTTEFQLKSAKSTIKEHRQNITDYDRKILKLTKDDVALLGGYFLELWKLRANIEKQEKWIGLVSHHLGRAKLMLIDTVLPKLFGEITISDRPVKPRKVLIVTVGFVSGLLLSLLILFFLDFLLEMKKKRSKDK